MSAERLERELAELPDGGGPAAGWEGRVLATARMAAVPPPKRQPLVFAIAGAGAVVLASVVFLVVNTHSTSVKEKAAAARLAQFEMEMVEVQRELDKLLKEKDAEFQKLLAANTEEEKKAAQAALDRKNAEIKAKQEALSGLRDKARDTKKGGGDKEPKKDDNKIKVKCDPNDPLCGI
jgi:uncharacterized protein HemX